MNLRDDLQLIYDWIPAGSRVLDLGCGDGELLHALVKHKNCKGYGVEIDTDSVIAAIARGVNVIQADLEQGLQAFGDGSFDVIVLSQTIQAMQNVETILRDLTRVAKEAIVTFPNFGYWRNRFQVAFSHAIRLPENLLHQLELLIDIQSRHCGLCFPRSSNTQTQGQVRLIHGARCGIRRDGFSCVAGN